MPFHIAAPPTRCKLFVETSTGFALGNLNRLTGLRCLQQQLNMARVEPFAIERWMERYETTPGVLNIAETCVASISIEDLVALNSDKNAGAPFSTSTKLTYGAVRGSETLRGRVAAALYTKDAPTPLPADHVIITQGAIVANFLLFYTLVGPGDHVVCVYPTYQQLYTVPESLGAEVSLWKLKKENGYIPDVRELETLVKSNTKVRCSAWVCGC